jgi:hypothetical protein
VVSVSSNTGCRGRPWKLRSLTRGAPGCVNRTDGPCVKPRLCLEHRVSGTEWGCALLRTVDRPIPSISQADLNRGSDFTFSVPDHRCFRDMWRSKSHFALILLSLVYSDFPGSSGSHRTGPNFILIPGVNAAASLIPGLATYLPLLN